MTKIADRHEPIPSLTGVRGVAAFWVFMTHIYGFAAVVCHAPVLRTYSVFYNGFRGVDLFFILSGFILMHVHANDFLTLTRRPMQAFFITRFFRIYPLNTAVLLAMLPLVLLAPSYVAMERAFTDPHFAYKVHSLSFPGFIQNLLLAQSWTVAKLGEWNDVSWTLSAEVLGYMCFPMLCWLAMREQSWHRCVAYAFASLAALTTVLFLFHHANNNPTGTFGSVRMLFCFVAGIYLHRCYQLAPASLGHYSIGITSASLVFIGVTLFIPVAPVFDAFGFAALIFGLAYRDGGVNALFESRPAIWFGKLSFSFYLIHHLIIGVVSWSIGDWLVAHNSAFGIFSTFAIFLLCLLVANILYQFIERPSQQLGRRLVKRLKPLTVKQPPAATLSIGATGQRLDVEPQ